MSGLRLDTVTNHNTTTQSVSGQNTDKKSEPKISNSVKIIGGLSALAILGTGIYFAVRHGKTSSNNSNKFKTIVKEDGSMERLFPNGNRVNIKNYQNNDGGWSKTITVTDSNGKKVSERHKSYHPDIDKTYLEIETCKGYNSEEKETFSSLKRINKYKDKTEISNYEQYYNEKGLEIGSKENLIKYTSERKTTDKQGKTISENITNEVRNEFGTFDEVYHNIEYKKDGTISTDDKTVKYLEENLYNFKDRAKTVDANGNVLYNSEEDSLHDINLNMTKSCIRSDRYKIDADGKRVLDRSNLTKSQYLSKDGKDDYMSYYSKDLTDGIFEVRDYVRDENGIGTIVLYNENLDGSIIKNSRRQKSGADVSYTTDLK